MKMPNPSPQVAVPLPRDENSLEVRRRKVAEAGARSGIAKSFLAGTATSDGPGRTGGKNAYLGGGS